MPNRGFSLAPNSCGCTADRAWTEAASSLFVTMLEEIQCQTPQHFENNVCLTLARNIKTPFLLLHSCLASNKAQSPHREGKKPIRLEMHSQMGFGLFSFSGSLGTYLCGMFHKQGYLDKLSFETEKSVTIVCRKFPRSVGSPNCLKLYQPVKEQPSLF